MSAAGAVSQLIRAATPHATAVRTALAELEDARVWLALQRGGVWCDARRIDDDASVVPAGATLVVRLPPAAGYPDVAIEPGWIIHEDADLLVVDKPAGVVVNAVPWDAQGNLQVALARWLLARDGAIGRLHPAHRLDRETSGVLVFARSQRANAGLQRAFAGGGAAKRYHGLATGRPAAPHLTLTTGHGRSAHGVFRTYPSDQIGRMLPDGSTVKAMVTTFEFRGRDDGSWWFEAAPQTGRTHQIRLHLAALGCPLLGDRRYGGEPVWHGAALTRHLLHASRLTVPHPRDALPVTFEAPAPDWLTGS
jgi:23S rRNA pseudouridine1911/1915/1917 synthase